MDPRYTGRPASPRRYGQSGRSSTGRLDLYPPDYDSYYGPPRLSRESVVPGPRSSAERVSTPRNEPRSYRDPVIRTSRDDYAVAPRRDPMATPARRPLSVIAPVESPNRYRPVITSAADYAPSPYKTRPRDDEPYYVLPATSSSHHHRHFSAGGEDNNRYLDASRDRRVEKGGYRSSAPSRASVDYSKNLPQIREPRDSKDRDYGYEYTNRTEQVYRDTAPRLRARRGSDVGPRERYYGNGEDSQKPSRDTGPPVTTRGFSKIDPNGTIRHEYRIPRGNDSPSREHSLVRNNRDDKESSRLRPDRGSISVHQDKDGYGSNVEDRPRERRHRHRRNDSVDRDKDREPVTRHFDERRFEERARTQNRTDSEERRLKPRRHRDEQEDKYGSSAHSRRHEREEDDTKERKYRDETRKDKSDKQDKHDRREKHERHHHHDEKSEKSEKPEKHDHKKLAEGLGIGAAGTAATGLIVETLRHRRDKETSDIDDETDKPRRRDRRRAEADQESGSRSDATDEDYRERRRRRRREREERDKKTTDAAERENIKPAVHNDRRAEGENGEPETDGDEDRHGRRRHRRERRDSSGESSDEVARRNKERSRVRVVSPAKEPEKKPKGILRPPTEKFPEDPAPIREGVAPLKEAGKKGIPPNARWTKIDRRLVNPEALELGNERYEERPDYVIVLRVLSKEEIEKYAAVTQELRNRRAARGSEDEPPLAINDKAYNPNRGYASSDDEPPRQIDAVPYNQTESLPIRDRSIASDIPSLNPKSATAMADTVINAHQRSAEQAAAEEQAANGSDRERPRLPTEGSYHRTAPPNVQPPSTIPMYPPMPPASAPVERGPYVAPPGPPPMTIQDPAASWHGATAGSAAVPPPAVMGSYPAPPMFPGQPHSQGHTPPPPPPPMVGQQIPPVQQQQAPPLPPKEVENYPPASGGY